jgi:hypothetical protein
MDYIRKTAPQEYLENEEKTENVWVYDDEFVKGMIHVEKNESTIRFYQNRRFLLTQERQLEQGTTESIVKMER